MPTRLVLRESAPPPRLAPRPSQGSEYVVREADATTFATPPRPQRTGPPTRHSSSQRKVVGFRSSILRDLSNNGGVDEEDFDDLMGTTKDEAAEKRRLQLHLSNEDIRASPRLLGYLFASIGEYSIVLELCICLVS